MLLESIRPNEPMHYLLCCIATFWVRQYSKNDGFGCFSPPSIQPFIHPRAAGLLLIQRGAARMTWGTVFNEALPDKDLYAKIHLSFNRCFAETFPSTSLSCKASHP